MVRRYYFELSKTQLNNNLEMNLIPTKQPLTLNGQRLLVYLLPWAYYPNFLSVGAN